ncbi:MAG TPA: CDP-alcohol phosphatidyltransferase family protein [Terracidiphilus sp.]|nr:CDP-alcohol phosphatidyltransferase family protein [Terracidiphilus sp.]
MKRAIPWSMVTFRLLLAPAMVLCALRLAAPQPWLGAMIAAGFLSDVFDGILARRWGTATAALRVADSAVDMVFYIAVLAAAVARHGPVIRERMSLVAALLAMEAGRMLFDWIRYRRMASYHSYASKAWGMLLAAATIALLCFDRAYWLVTAALAWGILCNAEGIAMSCLLPEWTHDVKTLRRAVILRREMLAARETVTR